MNQAKNPECQAGRVDITVEQCEMMTCAGQSVLEKGQERGQAGQMTDNDN